MDTKTQDKTSRNNESRVGSPKKPTSGELRKDVGRATLVTTIVFIAVWLIVLLVASEKGAFGPADKHIDRLENPIPQPQTPGMPYGSGG